ncbi:MULTISPECIES: PfkB family carbohydrate kinase [Actinopolyspora]|uniref:RfaE bifunctional protein, domain I/rfaE bifunctional protein, domain II n=1 Tax=Actinopolyspora saharensis TaxID=995062 RepID=A0A1H0ZGH5_9ACTN|nr:PfkB family carbohydrate kinase [Actinopolyspora saharensis]NHD15800.1 bifunctional heptose 7-phosphate kinase/heptose 1-phosphate adenyltransferase [Actinopolyspora sp. BKK2]NHE74986.1 bifunctional heptose 7-phosphate kinase/heptose 1-phosphate adenyltransferase [Actinopolyspora sp. BKK1]SDQ26615.1 rfaE bifunctional protein, domain I/rfaE bifunctional protein, domain II [Actinopolyspora saharensis]
MSPRPVLVVGDALLDVDVEGTTERSCPDAPAPVVDVTGRSVRPGGAGLSARLAAQEGGEVVVVTGLGRDAAGEQLGALLEHAATLLPLPFEGETPCKTRIRVSGRSLARVDTGDGGVPDRPPDERVLDALNHAGAVLVADYGRGTTRNARLRRALERLPSDVPLVWDPHPRGGEPVARSDLVVPNLSEARLFARAEQDPAVLGRTLRARWGCRAVAVTTGSEGAVLVPPRQGRASIPASPAAAGDVCGAGDSFATSTALALAAGSDFSAAVDTAVERAGRFVSGGGAGSVAVRDGNEHRRRASAGATVSDAVARVRAAGGTLVAAGGCFDLLHPGHVRLLERARSFGDALVVCVNSDASVRRIKGPERPILGQEDRVRLLRALEVVDAVVLFDESSPARLLGELRPDVWVKGQDHEGGAVPEAEVVAEYGGRTAFVPITEGHSTTRLLTTLRTAG